MQCVSWSQKTTNANAFNKKYAFELRYIYIVNSRRTGLFTEYQNMFTILFFCLY